VKINTITEKEILKINQFSLIIKDWTWTKTDFIIPEEDCGAVEEVEVAPLISL
jgi:hypothetical protein